MKKSELKQLIREAIEEAKPVEQDPYGNNPNLDIEDDGDKHPAGFPGMTEEVINEGFAPETDEVGSFWVVEKPSTSATLDDICFECENVMYFARQVIGGLKPEDIKGVFVKEAKAKKLAEKLLADRDKKKDEVKKAAEAYKKMKEETLAKVQEYMKNKKETKKVVDELKAETK